MKSIFLVRRRLFSYPSTVFVFGALVVSGWLLPGHASAATTSLIESNPSSHQAMHIPYGSYPKAFTNLPNCPNGQQKAMPWLADDDNFLSGNNFAQLGDCSRPIYNGGSNLVSSWSALSGPWIRPDVYGGWALRSGAPIGAWRAAVPTTYPGLGSPSIPSFGNSVPIWSSDRGDLTPYYTNLQQGMCIYSNGTTLFRAWFNLTNAQISGIKSGAPGYDVSFNGVADDWYQVYVNGVPIFGSSGSESGYVLNKGSLRQRTAYWNAFVNSLQPGTPNLVAIQVNDKAVWDRCGYDRADLRDTGLSYSLLLHTPDDNVPQNTFSTTCTTLTGTARDPDNPGASLAVDIYMDGTSSANRIGTVNTGNGGAYSFGIAGYTSGGNHTFYTIARGITASGAASGVNSQAGPVSQSGCNTGSCGTQTFPNSMLVGETRSYTVSVQLASWWASYTSTDPALRVTVTDPNGTVTTLPSVPHSTGSTTVTSNPITITPTIAGEYKMTWTLVGMGLNVACPGGGAAPGVPGPPVTGTAAYAPYFASNGDVVSAGVITAWNRNGSGGYGGAGSQLAAIAKGDITGFVSGEGLPGGVAGNNTGSGLTFANTTKNGTTKYGGGYTPGGVPDYAQAALLQTGVQTITTTEINLNSIESGIYSSDQDITLTGSLRNGKNVTIIADGANVYIADSMTQGGYGNDIKNIPRLNVYARNGSVYVGTGVTQIYGVYYASGTDTEGNFYSCATGPGRPVDLSSGGSAYDDCKNRLKIYGAVSANKLVLSRTWGHLLPSTGPGAPPVESAEQFIYGPDLWLSQPFSSGGGDSVRYDWYVSLPPAL